MATPIETNTEGLLEILQMAQELPAASDVKLQEKTVAPSTSSQSVTPDNGYDGLSEVTVQAMPTATQATPSISVSNSGLITASATQTAGYVSAGTESATQQLTTQAAQTITPGTSDKTIASGRYLTGTQTIQGDINLVAGNIKQGVSIFGVNGSYEGVELNFEVVPNPQPSVAKENTIWVDTDRINNYYFSATQPRNMVNYDVWFHVGTSSTVEFNALKKGGIQVYPLSAKQMVSGVLKDVIAKTYQNGSWIEWIAPGTIFKKGYGWVWEYGYTLPEGSCEVTTEGIYMPSSTGPKNGLKTETTVDVGSYRTLHVKLTGGGDGPHASTNGFYFGFGNNSFDWPSNNWNAYVFKNQNYEDETELTLDISGVSNLYFKMFV